MTDVHAAMGTVLLRLTALEAMLVQQPIISGRYTAMPYEQWVDPIKVWKGLSHARRVVGASVHS